MTEYLSGKEFAERLPKSSEFDRSRQMAIQSAEVAATTKEQLETEVAAKNNELEEQGLIGKWVEFDTTEEFVNGEEYVETAGLGLLYNFYGVSGMARKHRVGGTFNGLTVLDTSGVTVRNMSGIQIRGIEPERFAVCASVQCPEIENLVGEIQPEGLYLIPLRGIEAPLQPRELWDDVALESLRKD